MFYANPWADMHNRMKEALVLLGRMPRAVMRPPLVKLARDEIDRIRVALVEAGLMAPRPAATPPDALDLAIAFEESAAAMDKTIIQRPRRIVWQNVLTVVSAAILISAEVFGAAFAGSWAIANLLALGTIGARILDVVFVLCGIVVMAQFSARRAASSRLRRTKATAAPAPRRSSAAFTFR